jgi:hypothetical protein
MVEGNDLRLAGIPGFDHAVGQPRDELFVDPVGDLTAIRVRSVKFSIGMSKTLERAVPGTLISEKTIFAGFHVFGNPLLQLFYVGMVQHHAALDRIDLADKKRTRSRVLAIEHLITRRDVAVERDAEILATGCAKLLVARIKAAQTRITDGNVQREASQKTP